MKIKFQRTGGFANIPVNVEFDTEKMEQGVSDQLGALLGKLLPFDQKEVAPFPDGCTYNLTVESDGQVQTLNTNDLLITDEMQELFDFLLRDE